MRRFFPTLAAGGPVLLADVELGRPIVGIQALDATRGGYFEARILVTLHRRPLGVVLLPLGPGGLEATALVDAIWTDLAPAVRGHMSEDGLGAPVGIPVDGLPNRAQPRCSWRFALGSARPPASIVIATCGGSRSRLLDTVSDALAQSYPCSDIVVVDNRPGTSGVAAKLRARFPREDRIQYVAEAQPGLSNARNRGAEVARGEIVAFTDDDVTLDPDWLAWLVAGFVDQRVACVTGLILPRELESADQRRMEDFTGYGKGFERRVWDLAENQPKDPLFPYIVGAYGSGANSAFRREALGAIGGFDPALGTGTAARGGEDLDIYVRCIQRGHRLVYEPGAMVRHAHDRDTAAPLKVFDYGVGLGAMLTKHLTSDRATAAALLARVPRGTAYLVSRRVPKNSSRHTSLHLAQIAGLLCSPAAYTRSVIHQRRRDRMKPEPTRIWVGEVELSASLQPTDVARPLDPADSSARLLVRLHRQPLGFVSIALAGEDLSAYAVRTAIRDQLAEPLERHLTADGLAIGQGWSTGALSAIACAHAWPEGPHSFVSVVVCTRDRPAILATCLMLLRQVRYQNVEFIIVDNASSTEETRECFVRLVGDDQRFRYVREPVPGLSRARNRGLGEAKALYVAFTDDDVQVDPWWLHGIVAGFARDPAAGIVTGLVPPAELDDSAQQFFDRRYSWAAHLEPRVFDLTDHRDESPLYPYSAGIFGTGANFAVDRELLMGLGGFDEALGAGSPAGGGEDLDAFVRVLRAGRSLVYEPSAIVWHVHRAGDIALRRQLFYYGVGFTAFLTKYVLNVRTLGEIATRIPYGIRRGRGVWNPAEIGPAPRILVLAEVVGMLAGPIAYVRGRIGLWRRRSR